MLGSRGLEVMSPSFFPRAGTGALEPASGPGDPGNRGRTREKRQVGGTEPVRLGWVGSGRGGAGKKGGAWAELGNWGAHQGFAVAAGDRAQGGAFLEVVYEAHAASQHRAGAQEVGDHLLPADAAIPGGEGRLSSGLLGPAATCLAHPRPAGELPATRSSGNSSIEPLVQARENS